MRELANLMFRALSELPSGPSGQLVGPHSCMFAGGV